MSSSSRHFFERCSSSRMNLSRSARFIGHHPKLLLGSTSTPSTLSPRMAARRSAVVQLLKRDRPYEPPPLNVNPTVRTRHPKHSPCRSSSGRRCLEHSRHFI